LQSGGLPGEDERRPGRRPAARDPIACPTRRLEEEPVLIRVPPASEPRSSEITPERLYLSRRALLGGLGGAAAALLVGGRASGGEERTLRRFEGLERGEYTLDEELTQYEHATHYNNFYEFGDDKASPARLAGSLRPAPWSVLIEGEVAKPGRIPLEALLAPAALEERVYRLRCVEAWSMVIPWVGVPLASLLERFEPSSRAKFVEFETLLDPEQLPGQRLPLLEWPYREGLRIDEAMHPLAILAVGMYGRELPNQNGAPLRLVVPWKYGFKSIKSIVAIRLRESRPTTTWNAQLPAEYGFFANVNPEVDHPRWSQRRERRIGELSRRATLPFNGYAEEVAGLYAGMDLAREF
jgi:sulfoxide reductase catalytic subunit YedY